MVDDDSGIRGLLCRALGSGLTWTCLLTHYQTIAEAYGCNVVEGVMTHQMKQFVIDGNKCVLNKPNPETKVEDGEFEENEVYAIDIVLSTGEGKPKVQDEKATTVYKRALDVEYQLKVGVCVGIECWAFRWMVRKWRGDESVQSPHHEWGYQAMNEKCSLTLAPLSAPYAYPSFATLAAQGLPRGLQRGQQALPRHALHAARASRRCRREQGPRQADAAGTG